MPVMPNPVVLCPEHLWTAGENNARNGHAVLIENGYISDCGPAEKFGDCGAARIDLPGATLLPGLIDAHSHLFLRPYNEIPWDDQVLEGAGSLSDIARRPTCHDDTRIGLHGIARSRHGRRGLRRRGAETRDRRSVCFRPTPLRRHPRNCLHRIPYGPAARLYRPDCCMPQGAQEANGVEEITRAVRNQAARGADWIKLYADYRTGPNGEVRPTFSELELRAAVGAAHDSGRPVAVHAMVDEAIRRAVEAGADTIEHGYGGTRETFALMAKKGTAFLPTLTAPEAIAAYNAGRKTG